jgi:transposase
MIPTPAQPKKRYGIGAVDYHTGETVVVVRRRKRRREIAELLEALLEKHPSGRVYVAWDNSNTHEDDEVEAVVRGAAGRLVLLYLPTYSPWLNPTHRDALAPLQAGGDPLRAVREREGARGGGL